MTELMQTDDLRKSYKGREVVRGVRIEVQRGEIVGLLGPNGAGKTTTFYMIVGLVRPDSGAVHFEGQNVTHTPMFHRARLGMGYLAQEPSIFRMLTVEENIMAILEFMPFSRAEREERLLTLLAELGLTPLAKQRAYTLSGGEKRRLEITRALVTNPSFVLLDEPFSGIDPLAVHQVQEIILALRERGMGILITDHNVRETLSIVDHAYLICEGEVIRQGTKDFLVNDPVSRDLYLGPRFSM
ncbi:MAG: LPS export ABC transporter ATP-binding protein [Verrucomicrobia bacterium]|nr:LPS export ABC transporter ATP-binding protein [Verrucomicrobiota bacterium]